MTPLVAIAGWGGLHPYVNEVPMVLLVLAPLFLCLGVFTPHKGRPFLVIALGLMLLGTLSLYVAELSGHAAAARVSRDSPMAGVWQNHHALAEEVRLLFTATTALFALLLLVVTKLQLSTRELAPVLPIAFLVFYGLGIVLLFDLRAGGQLAHEFGP